MAVLLSCRTRVTSMNTASERLTSPAAAPANPWWRGATIYQIYPRSFLDTNGDGVGDLPGHHSRSSTTWRRSASRPSGCRRSSSRRWRISATTSPTIARSTRSSARSPISTAWWPRRISSDLKVIIDQVLSHTSSQHAWFEESRQSRTNPKADWYVWADARADGTPPNNWLSIFGGVAWTWEPRRGQYYLHNFLSAQPDLNFHNPGGAARVARQHALLAGARRRWTAARCHQLLLPRCRSCATTRPVRSTCARRVGSRPRIRTASNGIATTTRSPRCCPSSKTCARLLDEYPRRGGAR